MSSSPTPVAARRLDTLTALRWWAAFAVFLFHMRNMVTFPDWMSWIVEHGHHGVTFFFVLSGFVLTWSWRREVPVRAFYWRRFARIYPLHLLTLLIAIPVFYRLVAPPEHPWIKPLDIGVLLLSVVVIQGWFRDPVVLFSGNPASWTLTVEAFFYALHPLLVRILARLRKRGALILAVSFFAVAVAIRASAILWPASGLADLRQPVAHLPSFAVGMAVAWAYRHGWRFRVPVIVPAAGLAVTLLTVTWGVSGLGALSVLAAFAPEAIALWCTLIIAAAATRDLDGRPGIIAWRPFVHLGDWSFAFYLIHAVLMYGAIEIFGMHYDSLRATALWTTALLAVSIVAAWALHRGVERPCERRLRRWHDRRLGLSASSASATHDRVGTTTPPSR